MTTALAVMLATAKFATIFGDGMVLQRDKPVPVWGTADAGEKVTVRFAGQEKTTVARADGRWGVKLDAMPFSAESRELSANEAKIADVVVGEVWLCSGQSNMNLALFGGAKVSRHAEQALDAGYAEAMLANAPLIRGCRVPDAWAAKEQIDYEQPVEWFRFESGKPLFFSALAYHFAQLMHQALGGVPIGVINCSWGGASILGFVPAEGYAAVPSLAAYATSTITNLASRAHGQPRSIWNAKICPMVPMAVKGMVWYQGESDIGLREQYGEYLEALWRGWAKRFRCEDLPIFVVQLTPHDYDFDPDGPYVRRMEILNAQANFTKDKPCADYVPTADLGDARSVHPNHKRVIAARLAAKVMKRLYGRSDLRVMPPQIIEAKAEGGVVTAKFSHVSRWQLYGEPAIVPFELVGADGKPQLVATNDIEYVDGGVIRLKANGVDAPKTLQYCWSWRYHGKLLNEYGNPMTPFKTEIR